MLSAIELMRRLRRMGVPCCLRLGAIEATDRHGNDHVIYANELGYYAAWPWLNRFEEC